MDGGNKNASEISINDIVFGPLYKVLYNQNTKMNSEKKQKQSLKVMKKLKKGTNQTVSTW